MVRTPAPPAPSLRELLSAAKLRECRPLVDSCQRFAQRFILALIFLSGYVHRSTLPQSRIRSTAPSEREPGGVRTIHPGARKPGGWRAIFIAPTKGLHHSSGYSLKSGVAGDFHRPYEGSEIFISISVSHRGKGVKWQKGAAGRLLGGGYSSMRLMSAPRAVSFPIKFS